MLLSFDRVNAIGGNSNISPQLRRQLQCALPIILSVCVHYLPGDSQLWVVGNC